MRRPATAGGHSSSPTSASRSPRPARTATTATPAAATRRRPTSRSRSAAAWRTAAGARASSSATTTMPSWSSPTRSATRRWRSTSCASAACSSPPEAGSPLAVLGAATLARVVARARRSAGVVLDPERAVGGLRVDGQRVAVGGAGDGQVEGRPERRLDRDQGGRVDAGERVVLLVEDLERGGGHGGIGLRIDVLALRALVEERGDGDRGQDPDDQDDHQ